MSDQKLSTVWMPEDIQTLFDVTKEEAEEFMRRNEGYFQDRITELGWGVWKTYGSMDGLPPVKEEG